MEGLGLLRGVNMLALEGDDNVKMYFADSIDMTENGLAWLNEKGLMWEAAKVDAADKKLSAFRTYCEYVLGEEAAAYHICGTYPEVHTIAGETHSVVRAILDQACALELPQQHRLPTTSWETMVDLVKKLPR